ncbi:MAG TPA: 4Fe-4S binding protein [candidate division Zixibacteria bacterium]|nr:4Fe-4S binding protein [candidate division Zixibacteria bacterium]
MARPKWFINLLKKLFPFRFFLARFTKIPGLRKIADYMLFHEDEIYMIPKDKISKTISINEKINLPDNLAIPSQIIEYFIEKANYHWIMNFCLCRTAAKCKNYPSELGCLFLGEAVLNIDPTFGKIVNKEEALEHIKKCREAGLVHIIGRNKIDTQWLDVGPGRKLMTICNCCECCCLWKILPNLANKISRKLTAMPGLKVIINDKCTGCGTCLEDVCYVKAIKMVRDKAQINESLCRACGRCIERCPNSAIELIITDPEYIEKTINRISSVVDVS